MSRSLCIHFFNLLDGSSYCTPLPSTIVWEWELPQRIDGLFIEKLAITGSRIMVYVHCWELAWPVGLEMWRIIVWDWKTGDLVRINGV